jgi:Lrp/AsnC family leucine-responsive transcriptional regulator
MELDRIDRQILTLLQLDGRLTNAALAEQVHLSPSACLRRVQRLEREGVIAGYIALLEPAAVGRATSVFVEVSLNSQREDALEAFERAVRDCPDIFECHLMTGGADYLLRVAVENTQDFERVHKQHLSRLPNVARIRSSFALRAICQRRVMELS